MGLTNLILLWQQTIRGLRDYGTSDSGLTTLTKIGRLDFSLRDKNKFGTGSICLYIFRFRIFAVILLSQQDFLYCLNKTFFFLFLCTCIFPLITIALSISFTIKQRLFARKEQETR
jgi:hypothetical protein